MTSEPMGGSGEEELVAMQQIQPGPPPSHGSGSQTQAPGSPGEATGIPMTPNAPGIIPSKEVTQFATAVSVQPSNTSEGTAAATPAWNCGGCLPDKQIWVKWSAAPQQGQTFSHKVQWCTKDSSTDADWLDDTTVGEVDFGSQANTTRLLIPVTRYGAYLRLKVWQSGNQVLTMDAIGFGKWS